MKFDEKMVKRFHGFFDDLDTPKYDARVVEIDSKTLQRINRRVCKSVRQQQIAQQQSKIDADKIISD